MSLDINHLCYIILTVEPARQNKNGRRSGNMAVSTLKKVSVSIKLENGRDEEGNMRYTGISLGSLDKDNFDADKALAIAGLLEPCLAKNMGPVEKTEVSTIAAA